jgi:hypothetical protein
MSRVSLSSVRTAVDLAKAIARRADENADGTLTDGSFVDPKLENQNELRAVRLRDSWVTRNLFQRASYEVTFPRDVFATVEGLGASFERGLRNLERADRNEDGFVEDAELQSASRVGKALQAFAQAHAEKQVDAFF